MNWTRKYIYIIPDVYEVHFKSFGLVCFFIAVKLLIAINRIQNKSFCLNNICVLYIFIMYI